MLMRLNLSSANTENPLFRLELSELMPASGEGLPPTLHIALYAQNAKGRSEVTVLEDITLNDAEKRTDGSSTMSILPIAALLTGSLLTLGIAVLLIIVLAVRKKRRNHHRHCSAGIGHCAHELDMSKQPKMSPHTSRPGSMLEINTGDHRYVVAYTLKPTVECNPIEAPVDRQPDILNTPRAGADSLTPPGAGGALPRPDALFTDRNRQQHVGGTFTNFSHAEMTSVQSAADVCSPQTATLGRSRNRHREMPAPFSTFATLRRDHIIADSIPGPESCV